MAEVLGFEHCDVAICAECCGQLHADCYAVLRAYMWYAGGAWRSARASKHALATSTDLVGCSLTMSASAGDANRSILVPLEAPSMSAVPLRTDCSAHSFTFHDTTMLLSQQPPVSYQLAVCRATCILANSNLSYTLNISVNRLC